MNLKPLIATSALSLMSLFLNSAEAQIVINSQFKPFSYEEMMAPLQAVQEFHNQCLETLQNLLENAEKVEPYINKEREPLTWRRYADYYNSVASEYRSINENGVNKGTRGRINTFKKEYSKVINGIISAYNRRNEKANYQFKRIQSTQEKCSRYFLDISLDEFLDGKTPIVTYTK